MTSVGGRLFVAMAGAALMAVVGAVACLGSLPAAVACPPADVYAICAGPVGVSPPGTAPGTSGGAGGTAGNPGAPGTVTVPPPATTTTTCDLSRAPCITAQGRACACAPGGECKRDDTTCTPAPDCPASVRAASGSATCIEATVTYATASPSCICGCASCASFCDGQGPLLGPNQSLHVSLGDLPSSGRLGVMVRLRGSGAAGVIVAGAAAPTGPLGSAAASGEFAERIVGTTTWDSESVPRSIEIVSQTDTLLEVDCVVPFLLH